MKQKKLVIKVKAEAGRARLDFRFRQSVIVSFEV
jgi:hypothetical protein